MILKELEAYVSLTNPQYNTWKRYGASLGGALWYINNPTLRLFSHTYLHISRTRLHTMSNDVQTRRHKKHKQQTNTTMAEPLASPAAWI